ncbi:inward rectifier potassium channel [Cnuella takakiae]|uniref:Inward rectifier potassium channel n=1 Tax=Cnuella takakiae TaxID=1302690 RepID=A0A1M4XZW5_9BACT|nr:ion channel [Cnuella takakiae]OLY92997.1 transporter [Cnuella takakiae]SHE98853.1 inward rectifier potassium channel [Cnuella takakiae]
MAKVSINPSSNANPDTGFGTQANRIGGRFVNKDGSFNLVKTGLPFWKRLSPYSHLMQVSWWRFLGYVVLFYMLVNTLFDTIYLTLGVHQFEGLMQGSVWLHFRQLFYFSTQTFTTVGYGRINPLRDAADLIASFQIMCGWLFFALVTGLLYGRFTQPKAFIAFSHKALVAPYCNGSALMFRMVPYKNNHFLTNAQVSVNAAFLLSENKGGEYQFFSLQLERKRIDTFNMNWTVVHPIDENSPFLNFSEADLGRSDLEIYVQVSGFDPIYSNTVMQRTSYTYQEVVWGARFLPMYHESEGDESTILELDKLDAFEPAGLPVA